MRKEIIIFLSLLLVGVFLWSLSNFWSSTETYDYGTTTYEILAGNETYPGFRALTFSVNKGDIINIRFTADKSISYAIVTNNTYWDWGTKYYTQTPPPDLIHDYPNYGYGWRVLSGEDAFIAPEKGVYAWVFLNTHNTYAHVTVSGSLIKTVRIEYSEALSYCGITIGLIGALGIAYQVGKLRYSQKR
jgi:hypothetical protein